MSCDHYWINVPGQLPVCIRCQESPHASPSQIEKYDGCQRAHWYSRNRPRGPEHPAAGYGQRCHDLVELWGQAGSVPDVATPEGRTVMSTIGLLPRPGTAIHEGACTPVMGGIAWSMRIDWIDEYVPGKYVSFGDYKTTGSIERWAKTAEYLATKDVQAISYAHYLCERYNVPEARGTWVYGQRVKGSRKPPPGRAVAFTVGRDEIRERFAAIAERARAMGMSATAKPGALPQSFTYCDAFNRECEHAHECYRITPPNQLDLATRTLHTLRTNGRINSQ